MWSDKKNQRGIFFYIAWFFKEDGANSWSMELLRADQDTYNRTKVSLVIEHTPGDTPEKKKRREEHLTKRTQLEDEAKGKVEKKVKRRLSSATKAASRMSKRSHGDPQSAGDVYDQLAALGAMRSNFEVLLAEQQKIVIEMRELLDAHNTLKIFYNERVGNLAQILNVQLQKAAPK